MFLPKKSAQGGYLGDYFGIVIFFWPKMVHFGIATVEVGGGAPLAGLTPPPALNQTLGGVPGLRGSYCIKGGCS